jgi:hypothetical protein
MGSVDEKTQVKKFVTLSLLNKGVQIYFKKSLRYIVSMYEFTYVCASIRTSVCTSVHTYIRLSVPKKLYTLEGKPPSAFVPRVVGEGLSTLTDFVQKSRRE